MSVEIIQFYTSPSSELFSARALARDPARSQQTPHRFERVVGIGYRSELHGEKSRSMRTIITPAHWGKQLLIFANRHLDEPFSDDKTPYGDYTVNCHQFASFMQDGTLYGVRASDALAVPLDGTDVPFGTHIVLGQNDIDSGKRARHSALALGAQAPDKCLQLTADDGVLAIDSMTALDTYYKNLHPTEPIAWHYAG